jgi:hypothetical protein
VFGIDVDELTDVTFPQKANCFGAAHKGNVNISVGGGGVPDPIEMLFEKGKLPGPFGVLGIFHEEMAIGVDEVMPVSLTPLVERFE